MRRLANSPIVALRERQKRNFLVTLLLSQGVPMLCGGDEMGRTQGGNNNAYCQDNEISWLHWDLAGRDQDLLEFTRRVATLRREHPVFRRRHFFQGRTIRGSELVDITWLRPDGEQMTDEEWHSHVRAFGMLLGGDAMLEWDENGEQVKDDTFLLLFNGAPEAVSFTLPATPTRSHWKVEVDTQRPAAEQGGVEMEPESELSMEGRSVMVLRRLE